MKIVLYTAIYGNKDKLHDNHYFSKNIDHVCFTDNISLKSNFWNIIYLNSSNIDPVRSAKIYKILPHKYFKNYDFSIWIDGNINILTDINELIQEYNNDLSVFDHNSILIPDKRNCIFEEAEIIKTNKKDDKKIVEIQIEKYKKENYPKNNGLACCGIILRKHNNIINLMNDWWKEIENGSRRDQLSFNYVCWKNNFNINYIFGNYRNNKFFKIINHIKK